MNERREGNKHWPPAIKDRVWALVEEGRSVQAALDIIETETGEKVPLATASRWVLSRRGAKLDSGDRNAQIGGLAERVLNVLSRELGRMERGQHKLDLDRLDKIARTLRALDGLTPSKRTPGTPRTLTDLTAGAAPITSIVPYLNGSADKPDEA